MSKISPISLNQVNSSQLENKTITQNPKTKESNNPPQFKGFPKGLSAIMFCGNIQNKQSDNNCLNGVKAVIFDLDGVITDTAKYHFLAWQKLANELGIDFTEKDNEQLRGVGRKDSLLKILELGGQDGKYSEEKLQEFMDRKNNYYVKSIENVSKDDILPGINDLLDNLKDKGYKIALGSSSKNAKPILEKLGLTDKFDAICDGYSAEKSKPAPDLFLAAANELNMDPEKCAVVEDAASGIQAAKSAGMAALGVGAEEEMGKADLRFKDTANLSNKARDLFKDLY